MRGGARTWIRTVPGRALLSLVPLAVSIGAVFILSPASWIRMTYLIGATGFAYIWVRREHRFDQVHYGLAAAACLLLRRDA